MTKTISSIVSAVFLSIALLLTVSTVQAQSIDRYWTVKISKPAPVMTSSTINLDYIVFSTVSGDTFDVTLLNNGSSTGIVQTLVSTGKGGDSGRFTVNNVPEGTYGYSVLAKNTADGSSQVSDSSSFTVNLPDSQTVVASNVNGETNVTAVRTNTTANGTEVATAVTTGLTETSSAQANTAVQGASDNNSRNFTIAGLLLLALAGGAVWYGISNYLNKKDV
jgi:hypothetical protein